MRRLEIAERAYRLAAGSGHTGMEVWCWDWLWMWLGWGGMLVFGWSFMFGLRDHIKFSSCSSFVFDITWMENLVLSPEPTAWHSTCGTNDGGIGHDA